ncbi:MAG TPA: sulfotransferase [Kiritimatiellia bacterium]|nr:sulfotransferase [Kiritimatiellia bacterium]
MTRDLYHKRTRFERLYNMVLDNRALAWVLERATRPLIAKPRPPRTFTPIVIVGPARSGTTLVYQYLAHRLSCCYITNLTNRFPRGVPMLDRLTRRFPHPPPSYTNALGRTPGLLGPSQAITFWKLLYAPQREDDPGLARNIILRLQEDRRAPFLSKWQGHNPHIADLEITFASPLFLHVTRQPGETARSIHDGWLRINQDPKTPLSSPTRSYPRIEGESIFHNACAYVAAALHDLHHDLGRVAHAFPISYEAFCSDPESTLHRLITWNRERNLAPLALRKGSQPVQAFPQKRYPLTEIQPYVEAVAAFTQQLKVNPS